MGVPACIVCEKCGSTLAEGPNSHPDPQPHDWREEWHINKQTGERWKERRCLQCYTKERIDSVDAVVLPERPETPPPETDTTP